MKRGDLSQTFESCDGSERIEFHGIADRRPTPAFSPDSPAHDGGGGRATMLASQEGRAPNGRGGGQVKSFAPIARPLL